MALATRARTAGILALSLLVLSLLAPAAQAAPLASEWSSQSVAEIGNDSCQPNDSACLGLMGGGVGNNSCNGVRACYFQTGTVGDSSCGGDNACNLHNGDVGNGSCNGQGACGSGTFNVGWYSCNGLSICNNATADVGTCQFNTVTPTVCDPQSDARVRRIGNHNMVGDDIYNAVGTNQTLSDTLGDRRVRFVITIQNDSALPDSFTVGSSNGVTLVVVPPVNFYHGWHPTQDITAAVMAGTYTTPTIQPGGVYRIRAVVRPLQINFNHLTAGVGLGHYSWLVTAKSVANPTKSDAVRFEVDVQFT